MMKSIATPSGSAPSEKTQGTQPAFVAIRTFHFATQKNGAMVARSISCIDLLDNKITYNDITAA